MPLRRTEVYNSANNLPTLLSGNRVVRRAKSSTLTKSSTALSLSRMTSPSNKNKKSSKMDELTCLAKIKRALRETPLSHSVSNAMLYRFASFYSFDEYATIEAILRDFANKPQLHLKMTDELLAQFHTRTLFPLPDLKTKDRKCNVFYMRPSRHFPSSSSDSINKNTSLIIDNLCYILNDMSRTKGDCRKGVALVANMEGWTHKNFSHDYCFQFMQALQGRVVPTKVRLFLIVNPPRFFGTFWKIIKPMLSKSFAKHVHIIKEQRLGDFLMEGYQEYLPDEFAGGLRDTNEICEDFIDLKRYEEEQQPSASSLMSSS